MNRPPRNLYERRGLNLNVIPGRCEASNPKCAIAHRGISSLQIAWSSRAPGPMQYGLFAPILLVTRQEAPRSNAMTPTAAARAPKASAPPLRDRLEGRLAVARAVLHRRRLDRERRRGPSPIRSTGWNWRNTGHEHRRDDPGGRSRRARVSGPGPNSPAKQRSNIPAQMVRPDHRQPRGSGTDPDLGAGQSRWRRRWARSISAAPMSNSLPKRRGGSTAKPFRRSAGPDARLLAIKQPIGVCGAITPWEFPVLDDHPKSVAGAGGRLHRGAQARQ